MPDAALCIVPRPVFIGFFMVTATGQQNMGDPIGSPTAGSCTSASNTSQEFGIQISRRRSFVHRHSPGERIPRRFQPAGSRSGMAAVENDRDIVAFARRKTIQKSSEGLVGDIVYARRPGIMRHQRFVVSIGFSTAWITHA
jgi:hypothetical protein